jgi:RNA polymerase sigma factor (sigma-70 family)
VATRFFSLESLNFTRQNQRMTERELIVGCQKGKAECQRELLRRYAPMLLTVCRRYAKDAAFAEDLLQESLLRIFKGIGQYEAIGSFEGWMRKVTINTALQQIDKQYFKKEVYEIDTKHEVQLLPDVFQKMGAEELLSLIATLPNGFRQVFNLYAIEGYSHAEISALLGIGESSSRSQLARARKLLQDKLSTKQQSTYS